MWGRVKELFGGKGNKEVLEEKKVKLDKKENEAIAEDIQKLKELIERGLKDRIDFREELRLKLNDAQRLKEFKEAQLPIANDVDAEILRDEIESLKSWISSLMDLFRQVTDDISEAKTALMSLQILELNLQYLEIASSENWKERIKELRKKMEEEGNISENFRALCSEVNKLVDSVKVKIEVLGKRKKEKEVEVR